MPPLLFLDWLAMAKHIGLCGSGLLGLIMKVFRLPGSRGGRACGRSECQALTYTLSTDRLPLYSGQQQPYYWAIILNGNYAGEPGLFLGLHCLTRHRSSLV